MNNSYIVSIREIKQAGKVFTLLLEKEALATLLVNINTKDYELGDIISTYTEKESDIIKFCKPDEKLETGEE